MKRSQSNNAIPKNNVSMIISTLMLMVLIISLSIYAQQSLRLDEAQSLFQTSHSTTRLIEIISEDVHVPLYHLLLRSWRTIWGSSVFASRVLSLIFFILIIPATYLVGKKSYGRAVGLFSAVLISVSPFLYWYGNEIRMYSLLVLIMTLNQFFFVFLYKRYWKEKNIVLRYGWEDARRRSIPNLILWSGYMVTAILGIFTHYFFWLALLVQGMFIILYRKKLTKGTFSKFIFAAIIVLLAFSPWIYTVMQNKGTAQFEPNFSEPGIIDIFNIFSTFVFGLHSNSINSLILSLWPISVLIAFFLLNKKINFTPDTAYHVLVICVPIFAVFLISVFVRPIFLSRYFIFILPSIFILMGRMLSLYRPTKIGKTVTASLLVVMISGLLYQAVNAQTPVKENFREVSAHLMTNAEPDDIVVVSPPFTIYPIEYYYTGPASIETLPQWDRLEAGPIPSFSAEELPGEVNRIAGAHENLWLITSFNQGYEEEIVSYFENNYERLEKKEFSPGLIMYSFRLRYDTPNHFALLEQLTEGSAGSSERNSFTVRQTVIPAESNQSHIIQNNDTTDNPPNDISEPKEEARPLQNIEPIEEENDPPPKNTESPSEEGSDATANRSSEEDSENTTSDARSEIGELIKI